MSARAQPTTPDDELVRGIRSRDPRVIARAVGDLRGVLERLARGYLHRAALVDEVIQETWIGVVRGIARFEGRSSFRTWVCRILINQARTAAAREGRHPLADGDPDEASFDEAGGWRAPPVAWTTEDPGALVARADLSAPLAAALAALPERQRTIVLLRDVEGWSAEEVCEALDLEPTNQRVLLHRGRARLRKALEPLLTGGSP